MGSVPTISLHDFEARRPTIIDELMEASTQVGFLCVSLVAVEHLKHLLKHHSTLSNHGISAIDVQSAFDTSAAFFALEDGIKSKTPLNGKNAGWEKNTQVRPSTGTADQKESMQLQFARMDGLWPSEGDLPEFRVKAESFMNQVQQ